MDAIVGQNGQPGLELKFKGPEKYKTQPWKKLEIFYARNKKTVGETEKWQDIGKKEKIAILHRLYIIGQNGIYIYLNCIFFQNMKVL